jgi:hypothetical protein
MEGEGPSNPQKGERISANHLSAGALMTELTQPPRAKARLLPR